MSSKRELLQLIIAELNSEMEVLEKSAQAAHEAATHEESKAEDAHDTRGVEASYLAGAQSARLENLKRIIAVYQGIEFRDFKATDPIDIGTLVELDFSGKRSHYFLVNVGGGKNLSYEGKAIQMITPQSPMGEAVLGRKVGETIEVEGRNFTREYKVVSIS